MAASVSQLEWQRSQDTLREEVGRVSTLLRSIRDPGTATLGQWNLTEVAVHLSRAWLVVPGLARGDVSVLPSRAGESRVRDLAHLSEVTTQGVRSDPERDLGALVERIESRAREYFSQCATQSPDERRPWMVEGTTLPQPAFTYHMLSETIVHGYDIARAAGCRWPTNPAHAALVLERFFIPVLRSTNLVNPDTAAGVRATYELRIRGGGRFHVLFSDGTLRIEAPCARRVDCYVSADPVALLLVVWNRRSQWPTIARGQLIAWGRKPWLGPWLRGFLLNP